MPDPNSPCASCAFGKTGGAADEVYNRLRGKIAAYAGSPFWCHHSVSGPEYDWRATGNKLGPLALHPSERRLCAGWKAAVRRLYGPGGRMAALRGGDETTALLRRYQRGLGAAATNALKRFVDETDPVLKDAALRDLQDAYRAVFGLS